MCHKCPVTAMQRDFYYSKEKLVCSRGTALRGMYRIQGKLVASRAKDVRDGLRHDLSEEPPDFSPEDSFWDFQSLEM